MTALKHVFFAFVSLAIVALAVVLSPLGLAYALWLDWRARRASPH